MPHHDILPKVAAGVASELAAAVAQFSLPFEVERSYADWELPLDSADAGKLRLDVVPGNTPKSELVSRGQIDYRVAVDLVLRQKLGQDAQDDATGLLEIDEIDKLVALVFEISEFFTPYRLNYDSAAWEETEIRAAYIAKHLRHHRQFTAIVRLIFSVTKDLDP